MQVVKTPNLPVRPEWLAKRQEDILAPELPIVDAHHHLWDRHGHRYMAEELHADTTSGHKVVSTVYIQARSMLRADGPPAMRPVGEVEFANGVAAMAASGIYGSTRWCEAIVGGADLALGDAVAPVLEAMMAVAGGRLRGIRTPVVWHEDPSVQSSTVQPPRGLMLSQDFQRGAALLARHGLSLDVWAYHTQHDEIYELARRIPDVTVVIDHFGGPIGVGPYAGKRDAMMKDWRASMARLASLPNTCVKLGGAGMPVFGFTFDQEDLPPASELLAQAWKPYFDTCVELFGADRCLCESNFPVDKGMFSYHVVWNAFKRLVTQATPTEQDALLRGSASHVYRLGSRHTA